MKKYLFSLAFLLCLFAQQCSDKSESSSHDHHGTPAIHISNMELNHGKKWEMDQHTRLMISTMGTTFKNTNHNSLKDLHAMSTTLKGQLSKLITGCTMKGPSHDQLHVILSPIQSTIGKIANAKSLAVGKKHAIELKGLFTYYNTYFK